MSTVRIIFWVAVGLLAYTYILYPLILVFVNSIIQTVRDLRFLFRRSGRRVPMPSDSELPSVSLVIPAYNEEAVIAEKLKNALALDYPADKLEIVVGSDGSDDRTNEIVGQFADRGVKLAAYPERRGKPSVINDTVERATGEIVVLSDATTLIDADAVRRVVRRFLDPKVGAVNGELRFESPDSEYRGEGLYWRYEVMLKFMENRLGVVLGSSGALCAVRKTQYRPIPPNCICDDFLITMNMIIDGHRAVYDPEARSTEQTAASVEQEVRRRERIGAGNFQALRWTLPLLSPTRGWMPFCYLSHKIFKWTTWLFMLAAFATNAALVIHPLYRGLFVGQLAFYCLAGLGAAGVKAPLLGRLARALYYFVAMHLALFRGFVRYVTGRQSVVWARGHR